VSRCFVIQPFGTSHDDRYDGMFSDAIRDAGLTPYRVDRDPSVAVPIEGIESGIRDAVACLADVSTDNPNVWFEVGYAMALGKPVLLVSSIDRERFPFDIQHRTIVRYRSDPENLDATRAEIAARLRSRRRGRGSMNAQPHVHDDDENPF
jgi:hypothetical protein